MLVLTKRLVIFSLFIPLNEYRRLETKRGKKLFYLTQKSFSSIVAMQVQMQGTYFSKFSTLLFDVCYLRLSFEMKDTIMEAMS